MRFQPDGKIQIADHPLDDGELLEILGSKNRDIGAEQIEQLRHDRTHTRKMAGARRPAHHPRERVFNDLDRSVQIIHIWGARAKDQVAAVLFKQGRILLKRPRIPPKVFGRPELYRIHKNTGRRCTSAARQSSCSPDQREMPFMEGAHCRN